MQSLELLSVELSYFVFVLDFPFEFQSNFTSEVPD